MMNWHNNFERVAAALAALLLVVGLGACASTGQGGGAGDTYLVVQNNLIPSASVSVYASPAGGVNRRVGTVPPSTTDTLQFSSLGTAPYRFIVEVIGGSGTLASNTVTLSPGAIVEWNLDANVLVVTETN